MYDFKAFVLLLVPLSFVVFLIGLVKPKWILFWMKQPDRLWASSVGLLMFMASWTAYTELTVGHRPAGQPGREQAKGEQVKEKGSPDRQNELDLSRMR